MSTPLRYLLIATHVPASAAGGGMVRYTVELGAALAARSDVELHVLVERGAGAAFDGVVPAARIHTVRALPTPVRSVVERYGSSVPAVPGGFDVVHGPKHLLPVRAGRARRVLTVHDMLPFDRPRDFAALKRYLLRAPYLASVRDADVVVAVSAASRARLVDYAPDAAGKAAVVPLAVSGRLDPASAEPVAGLVGRRFALVVGDASARKNLALAVETWPDVLAEVPDAVLAVAGPATWAGDHRGDRWEQLVEQGRVVPLGHVSDAQLTWCYRTADVVLCPSLLEGFGLPSVEAAALGARVLTSDDPALCEASGAQAEHVAAWDRSAWVDGTVRALRAGRGSGAPSRPRTWADVADGTLRAVRAGAARDAAPVPLTARTGVDPFAAPLRVRHVLGPDAPLPRAAVERIAQEHRSNGWDVDVRSTAGAGPGAEPGADPDVLVLHGRSAGRLRGRVRGRVPTVVLVGRRSPGGPVGSLREARLARWTNTVVVDPSVARRWTRIVVPLTSWTGGDDAAAVLAAVAVRARALGGGGAPAPPAAGAGRVRRAVSR